MVTQLICSWLMQDSYTTILCTEWNSKLQDRSPTNINPGLVLVNADQVTNRTVLRSRRKSRLRLKTLLGPFGDNEGTAQPAEWFAALRPIFAKYDYDKAYDLYIIKTFDTVPRLDR